MTPDRTEPQPDDAGNGVLSHTGNLDTTAIGFIGGATAQVNVDLSTPEDDDHADDDVIDDEVPFVIELPAEDFPDEPVANAEPSDEEADLDELADDAPAEDAHAEDSEVADELDTVDAEVEPDEVAHAEIEPVEESSDDDADETADELTDAEFDEIYTAEIVTADEPEGEVDEQHVEDVKDGAPSAAPSEVATDAESVVAPATSSIPVSRREAHRTGVNAIVPQPAAAAAVAAEPAERAPAAPEPALVSKRLGEFEGGRESADLLTADRLLDPNQVIKSEPEGTWQHFVYSVSGKRINLGDGKRARARKALDRRIATPLTGGARFVPVVSRKGGVGKTTVTTLLGMALADARDDRVIAVDANPDRGTLADRIGATSGKTVRDLLRVSRSVVGFNDLSNIVARDQTRLDVVASDVDPRISEAFSDEDYRGVADIAAHYYSIVLTDTGTGIVHSVMGATLDRSDQLVIVAGLSVDEARLASETLTWLETNGHAEAVRSAVVVLNNARPGTPLVQIDELETHFRTRVRSVVRMPYDSHVAAGSAIAFRDLQPATRLAARELAAAVVEGLRTLAPAA